ncbi:MAG: 6-phospho-beta-glucosidase [Candidatus Eremiobacteraeota bacterium]|nr:6-phospho-beta-glucosidase [Candidatus Eremiobacteraeota bacterium]MCW5866856.1 6-phospho-beta-glucosidase [Candidatus Eremiobacteraeota bacterium]
MKISILGAGAMRTPLLLHGLLRSDLPISRVDLYDLDSERLGKLLPVMRAVAGATQLVCADDSRSAIAGCDFVLASIRVGGMAARAHDEAVALRHGILGQETVGPAGFAKGLRTVPPLLDYARQVEEVAPDAYLVNFSNPVGIVTQAVAMETRARIIGICDTPTELFEEVARALGVPSRECFFDFVGLNHLGWLRQVYYRGHGRIHELLDQPEKIYRAPFFSAEFLHDLGMLPSEYCYFYYHPERAYAETVKAGRSRGAQLAQLNEDFFARLARSGDPLALYENYLNTRNSTYMASETGSTPQCNAASPALGAELTGYDKIALSVLRNIHFNLGQLIPLNVPNRGNLPELQPEDVVEVPCVVDSNGTHPVHVGALPDKVRELVVRMKDYERRTVQAALGRSDPREALARNPLVADLEQATSLVGQLLV